MALPHLKKSGSNKWTYLCTINCRCTHSPCHSDATRKPQTRRWPSKNLAAAGLCTDIFLINLSENTNVSASESESCSLCTAAVPKGANLCDKCFQTVHSQSAQYLNSTYGTHALVNFCKPCDSHVSQPLEGKKPF